MLPLPTNKDKKKDKGDDDDVCLTGGQTYIYLTGKELFMTNDPRRNGTPETKTEKWTFLWIHGSLEGEAGKSPTP